MKILICGFSKLKYMPYIRFYFDSVSKNNDIHILYWNRDERPEDTSYFNTATLHEFKAFQLDDCRKISKINNFRKYKKFAAGIISEVKPDFIIALHTMPAVLLKDILIKKYKGRYIFDFRDITYEKYGFFRSAVGSVCKNANATFVSSDGFRQVLPELENIYTTHNITESDFKNRQSHGKSDRIRIGFWGIIRDADTNIEIIKKISKDRRFELCYYGREQGECLKLKKYVTDNNIENVFFHGEYVPDEKYGFAAETDIIHNVYSNTNSLFAMTNKYYDGIALRIPQICYPGSFVGITAEKNGVGKAFEIDDTYCDKIWNYYMSLDREKFNENCDKALESVENEYRSAKTIIDKLLNAVLS